MWKDATYKLREYCCPAPEDCPAQNVQYVSWCAEYWTEYSIKKYARNRTVDLYSAFAGLFGPWFGFWVVFLAMHMFVITDGRSGRPGEPASMHGGTQRGQIERRESRESDKPQEKKRGGAFRLPDTWREQEEEEYEYEYDAQPSRGQGD
jgi:hypothetical protein